jgi:hypothetical protein
MEKAAFPVQRKLLGWVLRVTGWILRVVGGAAVLISVLRVRTLSSTTNMPGYHGLPWIVLLFIYCGVMVAGGATLALSLPVGRRARVHTTHLVTDVSTFAAAGSTGLCGLSTCSSPGVSQGFAAARPHARVDAYRLPDASQSVACLADVVGTGLAGRSAGSSQAMMATAVHTWLLRCSSRFRARRRGRTTKSATPAVIRHPVEERCLSVTVAAKLPDCSRRIPGGAPDGESHGNGEEMYLEYVRFKRFAAVPSCSAFRPHRAGRRTA